MVVDMNAVVNEIRNASSDELNYMIEEIKLLARGVFVLDADGVVQYAQTVTEVTDEPDYDAAMAVLNGLL